MARKSKLKGYKVTDGALSPEDAKKDILTVEQTVEKKKHRTLAEVMGEEINEKNTADFDVYRQKITSMNVADLEVECLRVNLLPNESRSKMITRLESQWKKNNSKYRNVEVREEAKVSEQKRKELLDILSVTK